MEDIKANTNQTRQRDYDKDPIIIEDYNPLIRLLDYILSLTFLITIIFILIPDITLGKIIKSITIIIIIAIPLFRIYLYAKDKRKILLNRKGISFLHDNFIVEFIDINSIFVVKQTFSIIYHTSQEPTKLQKNFRYLIFVFSIYNDLCLLITKFLFHICKDGHKSCRLYDSIIVMNQEGIINIMPTTNAEYDEIKEYFKNILNIKIENLDIYYEFNGMNFKDIPTLSKGE